MAEDEAPALPADAERLRAHLAAIPVRDLFRLLQKDKGRATRLLSGFRAAPDALRHPVVVSRLLDEAVKQPQFAQELAAWEPSGARSRPPAPEHDQDATTEPTDRASPVTGDTAIGEPDERLRQKLKQQRALLREKDEQVAALTAALAQAERERNDLRTEVRAARDAATAAQAQVERLRRQRAREARREKAEPAAGRAPTKEPSKPGPTLPMPAPPLLPSWEEALRRLLSRGRAEVVAEVCREALASGGESGAVYGLYADVLREQGDGRSVAEMDRRAAMAYLDRGVLLPAAESLARLFPNLSKTDPPLLRRLLLLAQQAGQQQEVARVFARLRATSPEGHRRFREIVSRFGDRFAAFVSDGGPERVVEPEESILLPAGRPADVTPRRLVRAVEANETEFVAGAREGIASLRTTRGSLADRLLEAVARENPAAVVPLTQPTHPVVVDASNVARHEPDPFALSPGARVAHLLWMRDFLLRRGFFPVLMLADANLRFHVDDRAAYLALVECGVVQETPPGTSADAALIAEARERGAPLVTNDRFWDWEEEAADVERLPFAILPVGIRLTPV